MSTHIKIAIVVSQFNPEVTSKLLEGALKKLNDHELPNHNIQVFRVPGAVEIPLVAKRLAKSKKYDGIIALGAVIKGETDHYEYVCQQVSLGCQLVAIETEVPLIFGVLTVETELQAYDRLGGKHGHKGEEAALACLDMISLMKSLTTVN